ncbi:hypothetical protein ACFFJY_04025 [Fictibacillus aquaticus]|uniref:Uncharacterized protein n=1 Tax=Fictibacillus aquaticus TaxID=2021314 RepID=A0A235F5F9_9BACL|nr:hypothetical protein [Fictibacillus aquaticus]OYD56333.1 hypothetical protein CGZ90_17985 [Fictibacillus aquaticus]
MDRYLKYIKAVVVLIAALGIGLQQFYSAEEMITVNKVLFVAAMAVIVPVILYFFIIFKSEMTKLMKKDSYRSHLMYRFRYLWGALIIGMFAASMYVFYMTYEVVF